jgi:hypothetical protein
VRTAAAVLYVYAVLTAPPRVTGVGLDGVPLRVVAGKRLVAVVGDHTRAPELGDDQLATHEALISRLLAEGPVLPLRFGTTVSDEEALRDWLRDEEDELLVLLEALDGAVELSVRADLPAGSDLRERLHRSLAEHARRAILFAPAPGSGRLRAAYLVDGEHIGAFATAVERLEKELAIELSCTGPWPPYSFVNERGATPGGSVFRRR